MPSGVNPMTRVDVCGHMREWSGSVLHASGVVRGCVRLVLACLAAVTASLKRPLGCSLLSLLLCWQLAHSCVSGVLLTGCSWLAAAPRCCSVLLTGASGLYITAVVQGLPRLTGGMHHRLCMLLVYALTVVRLVCALVCSLASPMRCQWTCW